VLAKWKLLFNKLHALNFLRIAGASDGC